MSPLADQPNSFWCAMLDLPFLPYLPVFLMNLT
jgi:hypothetical protein